MDTDRLTELLHATQGQVRGYIAALGVPPDEVDDIAQEAYLRYMRQPDQRPPDVEPARWIKGIARHLSMDFFRRRSRHGAAMAVIAGTLERHRTPRDDDPGALEALKACLARLPQRQRELIGRWYRDDVEIAAPAVEPGSARTQRRMMARLREMLRDCILRRLAEEGG